jgi:RNA ligase
MFTGPFTTTYKIDGSLGILWEYEGQRGIATRGSFTSEQAVRGTSLLTSLNYPFDTELYTYLFEIVYPENRIVVDYGDKEELVFLTAINKDSGMDDVEARQYNLYIDLPSTQLAYFPTVEQALSHESSDGEGFVLLFDNGIRLKHKFSEYIRLSRLITGLSVQSIIELLKNKQSVDELLSVVPDEFHDWIQSIVTEFKLRYVEVFMDAYGVFEKERMSSRKDIAIKCKDYKYKHVVFMLLDSKNPYELIYDIIKKEYEDAKG